MQKCWTENLKSWNTHMQKLIILTKQPFFVGPQNGRIRLSIQILKKFHLIKFTPLGLLILPCLYIKQYHGCVVWFLQCSISQSSDTNGTIWPEAEINTNPKTAFQTRLFCMFNVGQCSICRISRWFIGRMKWLVWEEVPSTLFILGPCPQPVKFPWDNLQLQMVNRIKPQDWWTNWWRNIYFLHFQVHLLMEYIFCHMDTCLHM
jgi:hypothetical protein